MRYERPPRQVQYAQKVIDAVLRLYEIGAVQVDIKNGFALREHRLGSQTPRTPIFFNLRDAQNPKPGVLTDAEFTMMAEIMLLKLYEYWVDFDAIAPIPNAGTPIAYAMQRLLSPHRHVPILPLVKSGEEIVVGDIVRKLRAKARVLLVDDVISGGGSKERPIFALREADCVVTDCSVFIDRQQGGLGHLKAHKVDVRAVLTGETMIQIGISKNKITPAAKQAYLEYLDARRN